MKFQLSTIVAFLLLFLTGHSLAYNRCYSGGMKWSDLGTEAELSEALIGLCDMFAGTQQISQKTSHCINIGDNHIVGSIKITDGPADGVFIDLVACISAMLKVRQTCTRNFGGELWGIKTTNSEVHGGQVFAATVRADPQPQRQGMTSANWKDNAVLEKTPIGSRSKLE